MYYKENADNLNNKSSNTNILSSTEKMTSVQTLKSNGAMASTTTATRELHTTRIHEYNPYRMTQNGHSYRSETKEKTGEQVKAQIKSAPAPAPEEKMQLPSEKPESRQIAREQIQSTQISEEKEPVQSKQQKPKKTASKTKLDFYDHAAALIRNVAKPEIIDLVKARQTYGQYCDCRSNTNEFKDFHRLFDDHHEQTVDSLAKRSITRKEAVIRVIESFYLLKIVIFFGGHYIDDESRCAGEVKKPMEGWNLERLMQLCWGENAHHGPDACGYYDSKFLPLAEMQKVWDELEKRGPKFLMWKGFPQHL